MLQRTNELLFIRRVYHGLLSAMALGRILEPSCGGYGLLFLRHRRRVRRGWNPAMKILTLAMITAAVEKENPWVKLVCTVDPLKEEATEVGLQKRINYIIANTVPQTNNKKIWHNYLHYNYNMCRSNVPQYPDVSTGTRGPDNHSHS